MVYRRNGYLAGQALTTQEVVDRLDATDPTESQSDKENIASGTFSAADLVDGFLHEYHYLNAAPVSSTIRDNNNRVVKPGKESWPSVSYALIDLGGLTVTGTWGWQAVGQRGYGAASKIAKTKAGQFANVDLQANGDLAIAHNFGFRVVGVTIANSAGVPVIIGPDQITFTSESVVTISFGSRMPIAGAYSYLLIGQTP